MKLPPDHFWDFIEDGDFDKFVAREREMTRDTRRAPHMERYTKIVPVGNNEWRVKLSVGNQSFQVNFDCETRDEAEWMRDMLCIALDALVKEQAKA